MELHKTEEAITCSERLVWRSKDNSLHEVEIFLESWQYLSLKVSYHLHQCTTLGSLLSQLNPLQIITHAVSLPSTHILYYIRFLLSVLAVLSASSSRQGINISCAISTKYSTSHPSRVGSSFGFMSYEHLHARLLKSHNQTNNTRPRLLSYACPGQNPGRNNDCLNTVNMKSLMLLILHTSDVIYSRMN
jgi:hypothetical protein